ncbi:MAG TPA: DNA alkylation repair protein [Flavobacteriales bacterium]|nr:DNA alkylation repair protein [Flavobacteriales bacterium]HRO39780.1 DNA alkylation repair protein [Flavobacteriales bacterium]HRP81262.1 DNA alkylation repair protein [Flavobacteriales bacterium]
MHPYLVPLRAAFHSHAHPANAAAMRAYMKDRFPFFGLKAPERRALQQAHLALHGMSAIEELPGIVRSAFAQPERELHYAAVDLLVRHAKKLGPEHLPLLEELITTQSWWDTVDALAVHVVGAVLKKYPSAIEEWNERWIKSDDLWLNRTAILFQNRWKEDTDQVLLFVNIDRHAAHTDFFIRKAIGWALREYGKTDPGVVLEFVRSRKLSPLSEREAVRNL